MGGVSARLCEMLGRTANGLHFQEFRGFPRQPSFSSNSIQLTYITKGRHSLDIFRNSLPAGVESVLFTSSNPSCLVQGRKLYTT